MSSAPQVTRYTSVLPTPAPGLCVRACSMVHGRLIRAFAARARQAPQVTLDDVTQITRRMQDAGVSPDTITLNSALQVLLALSCARYDAERCF